jgi:RNA polymerase sigma factor (TIGR02999 family)
MNTGIATAEVLETGSIDGPGVNELAPQLYQDLRRIAHRRMAGERDGHTFSTTDLVHEAYLKLVRLDRIRWEGRSHFLALAAQAMRNILVDHALRRNADKRGGGGQRVDLAEEMGAAAGPDLLLLDRAMRRLEAIDARQSQVVECRVFAGMSVDETADALGVSPASIKRDWSLARAWLNRELAA